MQKLAEGAKIGGALNYARVLTRFAAVFVDGIIMQAVNFAFAFVLGVSFAQRIGAQPSDNASAHSHDVVHVTLDDRKIRRNAWKDGLQGACGYRRWRQSQLCASDREILCEIPQRYDLCDWIYHGVL
jgi:hypothetical protein